MLSPPIEAGEAAAITAKSWDHISRADLCKSVTPYDKALPGIEI